LSADSSSMRQKGKRHGGRGAFTVIESNSAVGGRPAERRPLSIGQNTEASFEFRTDQRSNLHFPRAASPVARGVRDDPNSPARYRFSHGIVKATSKASDDERKKNDTPPRC
jgi:hypothetical protein